MKYSLFDYLALFVASALLVGFITPKIRKLAIKLQIFDTPNLDHKTHQEPIPYLGGIAIIIGIVVVTVSATFFSNSSLMGTLAAVLLPSLFLGGIGLIDDLINLGPWPRFLAQTTSGIVVAMTLIHTDTVGSPTGSTHFDIAITIFFIVGLSNCINFFDNVDGGASGTVAISTFYLAMLAFNSGQYYLAAISAVIAGSTLGFLKWNRSPARIYMGDAGSLFLGSLLASILVRFEPNPTNHPTNFFVPLFLIAVPLLDTTVAVISRLSRRVSPFKGGRDHLSHRLIRLGLSKSITVVLLWGLTIYFGLLAILLSSASYSFEPYVAFFGSFTWLIGLILFLRTSPMNEKLKEK